MVRSKPYGKKSPLQVRSGQVVSHDKLSTRSSAYASELILGLDKLSTRSSTYSINMRGPSTPPYGIPQLKSVLK